jgi:hypothetical protein
MACPNDADPRDRRSAAPVSGAIAARSLPHMPDKPFVHFRAVEAHNNRTDLRSTVLHRSALLLRAEPPPAYEEITRAKGRCSAADVLLPGQA